MTDYTQRRFLVSCEWSDASSMAVLMEGCRAHADIEAWPLWLEDLQISVPELRARLPHAFKLEETWVAIFPTRPGLETFTHLLASIEFKAADYIRFVEFDARPGVDLVWTLDQFHKHVFHEM